jgi:hypothetical protein
LKNSKSLSSRALACTNKATLPIVSIDVIETQTKHFKYPNHIMSLMANADCLALNIGHKHKAIKTQRELLVKPSQLIHPHSFGKGDCINSQSLSANTQMWLHLALHRDMTITIIIAIRLKSTEMRTISSMIKMQALSLMTKWTMNIILHLKITHPTLPLMRIAHGLRPLLHNHLRFKISLHHQIKHLTSPKMMKIAHCC